MFFPTHARGCWRSLEYFADLERWILEKKCRRAAVRVPPVGAASRVCLHNFCRQANT